MARPYGRDPRVQSLVAPVLHRHWTISTFLTTLRHDTITAPYVIDRPINSETLSNSCWCRPCPG